MVRPLDLRPEDPNRTLDHIKSSDTTLRITRKMDNEWIEVSWGEMARLVPGRNPTKVQVKKLSKKFVEKDFKSIAETDMYPILVSRAESFSWMPT